MPAGLKHVRTQPDRPGRHLYGRLLAVWRHHSRQVQATDQRRGAPNMKELFRRFSTTASDLVGSPWTFMLAVLVVIVWGVSGPVFGFSDTWQLVINTGTTIVTFLMVFLVQNTQNRDAKAIHLKLDELILATRNARTGLVNLETLSDEELGRL